MSSTTLSMGSTVGKVYEILDLVATGGMGAVYRVRHTATQEIYALKTIPLGRDERSAQRVVLEAHVSSTIPSEHVVKVLAVGVDRELDLLWLCMEFLVGETLAARMQRTSCSVAETTRILEHVCDAVGAAHSLGIVHRDLKPDNLFLVAPSDELSRLRVKVLDFGIAKLVADLQPTQALGSPAWMAPEQATERGRVTCATDVWSLGLIAFWMLTGRSYWQGRNQRRVRPGALLMEVLNSPIIWASARLQQFDTGPQLPSGFDAWFARCVVREPSHRFSTAHDAWQGWQALVGQEPTCVLRHTAPSSECQEDVTQPIPPPDGYFRDAEEDDLEKG